MLKFHSIQQCQDPYFGFLWSKWVRKKNSKKNLCCWSTFVLWSILISKIQKYFHFLHEVRSWTPRCHCDYVLNHDKKEHISICIWNSDSVAFNVSVYILTSYLILISLYWVQRNCNWVLFKILRIVLSELIINIYFINQ